MFIIAESADERVLNSGQHLAKYFPVFLLTGKQTQFNCSRLKAQLLLYVIKRNDNSTAIQ